MTRKEIIGAAGGIIIGGILVLFWDIISTGWGSVAGDTIPQVAELQTEVDELREENAVLSTKIDSLESELGDFRAEARTNVNAVIRNQNLMMERLMNLGN